MLATTIRPKRTRLFQREAKGGGSEDASPNNSFEEGQFPFLQKLEGSKSQAELSLIHDDECIIQEKKSFDQSSDWSKASETEDSRSEAGYSIPYSHGEYSDAGSSSYAHSEISGPLLVKGSIMDWHTTTIEMEMESKPNLKDTSVLSNSSSNGTTYYSMPREFSFAMQHSASVTTPAVIQIHDQEQESEEKPPSNSDVTLIMEDQEEPILNILVSVPKESNKEQVLTSPSQVHIPKKFRSVAARLFRARNDFQMEDYPDSMESKEIAYLIKNYQQVSQRLKSLVASVKTYQDAVHQLQQARANFLRDCDELCMDTAKPHQEFVPRDGHYDSTFRSRIKVSQIFGAAREQLQLQPQQQVCSDQKTTSEENFYQQQQLLEYVTEWEDIVTADLGQQVYILKRLETNKIHYEKKTKKLQHWTELVSKDGASISGRFHTRRLVRNQDKLSEALQVYHVKEREIIFLLQQVTTHGWKDLYPLVEATLEMEMQRMKEEEDAFGRFFPAAMDTIDSVIGQVEKEDCMLRTIDVPYSMHGKNSLSVLDVLKDRSKPYLFVDDASPYATRSWIAMLEKEADPSQPTGFHLMHVCSALGGMDPGFCLLQQLGVDETPALVHNGNVLSGSASVAEYIDATILHPSNNNDNTNNGSLTPRHPVSRYNMNVFMDHHSKIEAFFFALLDTDDQTSRGQSALGLWMLLEEDLNKFPGPYLCGNQFTLADIHIFPFVDYILQVRRKQKQQHGHSIPSTLQALQSWYDKVSSRPSVQIVIGNPSAQFVEASK